MLNRVWAVTSGYDRGTKVEEHVFRDGSKHYSFKDRSMRASDISSEAEAMKIVKNWRMEDITDQMIAAGWISR